MLLIELAIHALALCPMDIGFWATAGPSKPGSYKVHLIRYQDYRVIGG